MASLHFPSAIYPIAAPDACVHFPSRACLLRFAFLLRLKDQGNLSVDFPFAGRIHALRSPCFAVAPAQAIRGLG
ncbi:MAG: hypothetical protein V3V96_17150, partial [Acidiferrobacterales bacterium]